MHRRVGSNGLINHQRRPSGNQPFQLSNQMINQVLTQSMSNQAMNQSYNPSMHSPDSQFSRASSVTTSNVSTPMNRYSNPPVAQAINQSSIYSSLNAAQSVLKDMKQRTSRSSDQYSNQSSPYMSSASTNPSIIQSANSSLNSSNQPANLKVKRKLRKNTREKQRRYELNDKFDTLQEILNLGNGATKVEKFTILSEAISTIIDLRRSVNQATTQNRELKQSITQIQQSINQSGQMNEQLERLIPNVENMSPLNNQASTQSNTQSNVLNFIAKLTNNQGSPTNQSMNQSSSMSMVSSPTAASSSPINPSIFQPNPLPSPTSFLNMNFHQPIDSPTMNQSNSQSKPQHRRGSSNNFGFASISSNPFSQMGNQSTNPTINPSLGSTNAPLISPTSNFSVHKRQNSLLAQALNPFVGMHQRGPSVKDEFSRYSPAMNQSMNQSLNPQMNQMSISPTHADMHAFAFPTAAMLGSIDPSMNSSMNQSGFPTAAMISQISQQVAMNALHQQQQLQHQQQFNPSINPGHRHQPSQDFKFAMASGSPATSPRAGFNPSNSQNFNQSMNQSSNHPSHIPLHRHNRSLSQNAPHFNFNLNVNLEGLNDMQNQSLSQFGLNDLNALSAYSVLPFDSPSTLYQQQRQDEQALPLGQIGQRQYGMEEDEQPQM